MLTVPREAIAAFCQRRRVTELSLFGSAVRDDFGPQSDVDVLVRFEDGDIRQERIWQIVSRDLPALIEQLKPLVPARP